MRARVYLLALMIVGPFTACTHDSDQPTGMRDPSSASSTSTATRPRIEASVKSLTELQQQIASHVGKVVVLDLWALW